MFPPSTLPKQASQIHPSKEWHTGPTCHPLLSLVAIEKFVYFERSQEGTAAGASIAGEGPAGNGGSRQGPPCGLASASGRKSRVRMEAATTRGWDVAGDAAAGRRQRWPADEEWRQWLGGGTTNHRGGGTRSGRRRPACRTWRRGQCQGGRSHTRGSAGRGKPPKKF